MIYVDIFSLPVESVVWSVHTVPGVLFAKHRFGGVVWNHILPKTRPFSCVVPTCRWRRMCGAHHPLLPYSRRTLIHFDLPYVRPKIPVTSGELIEVISVSPCFLFPHDFILLMSFLIQWPCSSCSQPLCQLSIICVLIWRRIFAFLCDSRL